MPAGKKTFKRYQDAMKKPDQIIGDLDNCSTPEQLNKIAPIKNAKREQELIQVKAQLEILLLKSNSFRKQAYVYELVNDVENKVAYNNAVRAVDNVYDYLNKKCDAYINNIINLTELKDLSKEYLINDNNKDVLVLKEHRGSKDILANLLLAFTGIGLLAIAAKSIYNGHLTLFKLTSTDSENKLNDVKKTILHLGPTTNE